MARGKLSEAERDAPLALLAGAVGTDNAYGRVVRDERGDVARIVETRLATAAEKQLPESNLGAYAADLEWLRTAVGRLRPNETGEIFLTDLVADARREGKRVAVHLTDDPEEGIGVNTRAELAMAETAMRKRIRDQHMAAGVTFRDPDSCQVDSDVRIAADVVIERGTILEGKTSIGAGSRVGPYAVLRDTTVGERCKVENSTLEGATLEDDVRIGPYSHLRPGAYLEQADGTAWMAFYCLTMLSMAIELAMRQWARNDPMAAAAAAIVDAARLKTASSLYRSLGLSARDADARAVLFYGFLFGQSMMFLDEAPRKRASLIAACARVLMDVEPK